jgi:hypothetical protein
MEADFLWKVNAHLIQYLIQRENKEETCERN